MSSERPNCLCFSDELILVKTTVCFEHSDQISELLRMIGGGSNLYDLFFCFGGSLAFCYPIANFCTYFTTRVRLLIFFFRLRIIERFDNVIRSAHPEHPVLSVKSRKEGKTCKHKLMRGSNQLPMTSVLNESPFPSIPDSQLTRGYLALGVLLTVNLVLRRRWNLLERVGVKIRLDFHCVLGVILHNF